MSACAQMDTNRPYRESTGTLQTRRYACTGAPTFTVPLPRVDTKLVTPSPTPMQDNSKTQTLSNPLPPRARAVLESTTSEDLCSNPNNRLLPIIGLVPGCLFSRQSTHKHCIISNMPNCSFRRRSCDSRNDRGVLFIA
ncbi:hypothetical protein BGY98DRAFT_562654 [Russula aff. rugulosa BPL654]|nr:hypothetical protein BGY98DRAFT_562654 [Russula aff. rugulosa BPL654]